MVMQWNSSDPPLEPRPFTSKQEKRIEVAARLEEVQREIRRHRSEIDDLLVEEEELEHELDELE